MIIGIDTGGTNVDAVLLDEDGVSEAAKVPNRETRRSIAAVLEKLSVTEDRTDIDRVVVATTLVVNAAVQSRLPACTNILIPGPGLAPERSFFGEENHVATGAVDHRGRVTESVDYDDTPSHEVQAVTAKFAARNPDLEREVGDALEDDARAVALGNESGAGLTFPDRAATTVANARSKPVFSQYEAAIEAALADVGLDVPIYYLKGDGAMLGDDAMLTTPAQTIRSGSAASALGLVALTGLEAGIAVDIGGTTTDVTRVLGGYPDPEQDVSEGTLETAYSGVTAESLPIGGDTMIEQVDDSVALSDKRVGNAVAFGGEKPTLTDALHALELFEDGDRQAAMEALATVGTRAIPTAETILAEYVERVSEAIQALAVNRTETIAVGGVLAPYLGPELAEAADPIQEYTIPEEAHVAGAVGCGVARVSVDTAVHIDSQRGVMTVTAVGPERVESVEEGKRYTDVEAREIVESAAREAADTAGGNPEQPVEIRAYDRFSVVERSRVAGQIVNARARVEPGIDRFFVEGDG